MDGLQSSAGQANLVGWARSLSPSSKMLIHCQIISLAVLSFLFSTPMCDICDELTRTSGFVKELQ